MTKHAFLADLAAAFDRASLSYCALNGFTRDEDWVMLKLVEEVGELVQVWNKQTGRGRPRDKTPDDLLRDQADEIADVLGMVLILAHRNGLDLESAIARKWRFDPSDLSPPETP